MFPKGIYVLKAGCGVGAQTKIIATKNQDLSFLCIDISEVSIAEVHKVVNELISLLKDFNSETSIEHLSILLQLTELKLI